MSDSTVLRDSSIHVPNADYTPNENRAVWVQGQLNEALLDRLRPYIFALTAQDRSPITVFIDSKGGLPDIGERILSLLRPQKDGESACRIITVALSHAQSGAADLLSAGDFAIANPEALFSNTGADIGIWAIFRGSPRKSRTS